MSVNNVPLVYLSVVGWASKLAHCHGAVNDSELELRSLQLEMLQLVGDACHIDFLACTSVCPFLCTAEGGREARQKCHVLNLGFL